MHPATGDGGESLTVHQLLRQLAPGLSEALRPVHAAAASAGLAKRSCPAAPRPWAASSSRVRTARAFTTAIIPATTGIVRSAARPTPTTGWQRQRARLLLPAPYFLVTFTVPEALRRFIRSHPADRPGPALCRQRPGLAGPGRAIPAGWARNWACWACCTPGRARSSYHPHVHYLVPGGGLSPDGRQWVPRAPSSCCRSKPWAITSAPSSKTRLQKEHPELFAQVPAKVWKRHWNVDSRPAGSGENALRYLSRYVFKTATANRKVPAPARWQGAVELSRQAKPAEPTSIQLEPLEFIGALSPTHPAARLSPACAPSAGCIRPPKCAPTACGPCSASNPCSPQPKSERGTHRRIRTPNCRPAQGSWSVRRPFARVVSK